MNENAPIIGKGLVAELRGDQWKSLWRARANYLVAYALYVGVLLSSGVTAGITAFGLPGRWIAVIAAIPAFGVLANNLFKFNERADHLAAVTSDLAVYFRMSGSWLFQTPPVAQPSRVQRSHCCRRAAAKGSWMSRG